MQHPGGNPRKTAQGRGIVQIANQRGYPRTTQLRFAGGVRGQGQNPHTPSARAGRQMTGHTHADIAATDNQ